MKTNQIFNFNRFGRYAKSTFIMHYKQLLLLAGGASVALFLYVSFITTTVMNGNWSHNEWKVLFMMTGIVGGLLYIGSAFSPLRKKVSTINFLLIPASTLEKFLYEFIEKILLFWLLFPTIFYVFGNLAIEVSTALRQSMEFHANMKPFTYQALRYGATNGEMKVIFTLGVMLFILAFTGAATFRKYPLIKTIVFCGAIVAIVAFYFYMMIEKMHLRHPWVINIGEKSSNEQGSNIVTAIMLVFSLIVLTFTYFKLKEKEVQ